MKSIKLLLPPSVNREVDIAIARYKHAEIWEEWGMNAIKENGNTILLHGEAGTGKTLCAKSIAARLGLVVRRLNVDKLGSQVPGQSERNVRDFFSNARKSSKQDAVMLFLDECDDILADRSVITESTWKVGMIEALLLELNTWKGLIVCATNHTDKIDEAMFNRFIAVIHISRPEASIRQQMWREWIPDQLPHKLVESDFAKLAKVDLTGRSIVNAICNAAGAAITEGVETVTLRHFLDAARGQQKQKEIRQN